MKILIAFFACMFGLALGAAANPPFEVSIVPEARSEKGARVSWGDESQAVFYVVLTNVSEKSQPLFQTSNSWGHQAISFEVTLPDGGVSRVELKPRAFKKNIPSTNIIPPRSHWVFPITLDKRWESKPDFAREDGIAVTMKAVYSINQTPESKDKGVWEGKVESEKIEVIILQR